MRSGCQRAPHDGRGLHAQAKSRNSPRIKRLLRVWTPRSHTVLIFRPVILSTVPGLFSLLVCGVLKGGTGSATCARMAIKQLSVVVPAYDEALNIRPLTERLFAATRAAKLETELIVADDESSGSEATREVVEALAKEGYSVRLHARRRSEGRGLSSAVLLGFQQARYEAVLCMDADLQHEPEAVPAIAAPVLAGSADFTVGSRNVGGGGLGFEWSLVRRVISAGATSLAWPLSRSSDPMSGFFCLRKATLARGADAGVNTMGFKIGLELMVRCRCSAVVDVPITFQERVAGESKLSMKQNVEYVRQLASLYAFKFGLPTLAAVGLLLLAIALFLLRCLVHAVL